jgi:hypothetical protein
MIISLGSSCKVRQAIQRHIKDYNFPTNMFDWVISNFDTILYFISNIDKPLITDDFYDAKDQFNIHRRVNHTKIRFDTLHDAVFDNPCEKEIIAIVDKYNRRLSRLKNIILNNEKKHFIHLVDSNYNFRTPDKAIHIPCIEDILTFNKLIHNINPNCVYYLHILIPPQNCRVYNINFNYVKADVEKISSNNCILYFLSQSETSETPDTGECRHWSWSDVFNNIDKINNSAF